MANDPVQPYTLPEYMRDIKRWCRITKVSQERMAPLVAMAIGGAARVVVDEMDDDVLAFGGDVDMHDGRGVQYRNGVELLFHLLQLKFPENKEARMLRTALE